MSENLAIMGILFVFCAVISYIIYPKNEEEVDPKIATSSTEEEEIVKEEIVSADKDVPIHDDKTAVASKTTSTSSKKKKNINEEIPDADCKRQIVHRQYRILPADRMDSLSSREKEDLRYVPDGVTFIGCSNNAEGTIPLYRMYDAKNEKHMLSTTKDKVGWKAEGDPAFVYAYNSDGPNRIPMYRRYSTSTGEYLTTADPEEAMHIYDIDSNGRPMFYALKK
jgi:hypothetical protein